MKKLIYLIFVGLIIIGCKKEPEHTPEKSSSENIETPTTKAENCIPYFEFDEVDYYHIDISDRAVFNLNNSKESKDKLLFSILNERTLSKLSDTIFIDELNDLGYTKTIVGPSDFSEFNQIFCERTHNNTSESACETIFRNILVLKKENRIVGTAKICFDCQKSSIAGTDRNTIDFGQSGDYRKLNNLLSKYRK